MKTGESEEKKKLLFPDFRGRRRGQGVALLTLACPSRRFWLAFVSGMAQEFVIPTELSGVLGRWRSYGEE